MQVRTVSNDGHAHGGGMRRIAPARGGGGVERGSGRTSKERRGGRGRGRRKAWW